MKGYYSLEIDRGHMYIKVSTSKDAASLMVGEARTVHGRSALKYPVNHREREGDNINIWCKPFYGEWIHFFLIFPHFDKGDNFCEFLFVFLYTKAF